MSTMQDSWKDYEKSIAGLHQPGRINAQTRTFVGWEGNTSIKSDYTRADYNSFRNYNTPGNRAGILKICQEAYDKVGIIKNVIDLMSDFGSKGVRIRHEVPSIERFYQKWFEKVGGTERSERFLSNLYRLGAVVIYKSFGVLPSKVEKDYKKIKSKIDKDGTIDLVEYKNRYIPIRYTFINPSSVEVIGENVGIAIGTPYYVLKLQENFVEITNNYLLNQKMDKDLMNKVYEGLPKDLQTAIVNKQPYFPLDPARVSVYNYRKDDWQAWGKSIIFSVLDDLQVLERLKLADISALDGAISNIRLWTVGKLGDNPNNTFIPNKPMLEKIRDILSQGVGGGTMDLVWGPELSFQESSTNVHEFLGEEKYKPTIDSIYDGLGIPSPLRSGYGQSSNSYVSLKTLVERLNYGRSLLIDFWVKEVELIQKACGFSKPGVIEFDYMVFTDEAAEKQLLINLADRDIISPETVREKFSINHKIEESKIKRDVSKRGTKLPHKASPYHSNPDLELKKIALSSGMHTPSEVGLELSPKKENEKSRQDAQFEQQKELNKNNPAKKLPAGASGRPRNVTETKKRNPKTGQNIKISKAQSLTVWANSTQKKIHSMLLPKLEEMYGKKNLRQLTTEEAENFEKVKCSILFNTQPMSDQEKIVLDFSVSEEVYDNIQFLCNETQTQLGRELSMDEKRDIYTMYYVEQNNG